MAFNNLSEIWSFYDDYGRKRISQQPSTSCQKVIQKRRYVVSKRLPLHLWEQIERMSGVHITDTSLLSCGKIQERKFILQIYHKLLQKLLVTGKKEQPRWLTLC